MNHRKKNALYSLLLVLAVIAVWWYRNNISPQEKKGKYQVEFSGEAQGTTYNIKYRDDNGKIYQPQIDSLLELFDQSLSTYIPTSEISQFNNSTLWRYELPYFYPVLKKSREIYEKTGGAFDPTIYPLVSAWGFGPGKAGDTDSAKIDSLLKLVNFDSIYFDGEAVCKMMRGMKLDFNAIAQGYSVDVLADFLLDKGIKNMMVEVGGEAFCKGTNENGDIWRIGIEDPGTEAGGKPVIMAVKLDNKAIATSGNYRKTREINGKRYAHTISPFTGYPVEHSLLSASVFAEDAMTADGYATAFMVMGLEKSIKIVESNVGLDAFFVYRGENGELLTYTSDGIAPFMVKLPK